MLLTKCLSRMRINSSIRLSEMKLNFACNISLVQIYILVDRPLPLLKEGRKNRRKEVHRHAHIHANALLVCSYVVVVVLEEEDGVEEEEEEAILRALRLDGPYSIRHLPSNASIIRCTTSSKNSEATCRYNGLLNAKSMSNVNHTD